VNELASLLAQPLGQVQMALSIACRLGFVKSLTAPALAPLGSWHPSWIEHVDVSQPAAGVEAGVEVGVEAGVEAGAPVEEDLSSNYASASADGNQRIGFLVDSRLSACLMMSNLMPGADELKTHAVTLYEVHATCLGKVPI